MTNDHEKLFAGAGVVVRKPGSNNGGSTDIIVETEHAGQVSNLFFALKKIFADDIDYSSKYEFYGRLADAANGQLKYSDNFDAIRTAMVDEACAIAAEFSTHLYFAYGSNMDADQMSHRCSDALFAGKATLVDYEFALDSIGVATVSEKPGSKVYGVLWLISKSDEHELDRYEGVACNCYRKAICPIVYDFDEVVPALLYISNRDIHDGKTYRTGYLDNIIENANKLGFNAEYIGLLEEN